MPVLLLTAARRPLILPEEVFLAAVAVLLLTVAHRPSIPEVFEAVVVAVARKLRQQPDEKVYEELRSARRVYREARARASQMEQ